MLIAATTLALAGLFVPPGIGGATILVPNRSAVPQDADGVASCRVTGIVDGDTVRIACDTAGRETARLTGFDTPELFSPKCDGERLAAIEAKRHLTRLVGDAEELGFVREGQDRYGRALVALSLDGRPVAREMIAAGHARPYAGGRRAGWCTVPFRPRPVAVPRPGIRSSFAPSGPDRGTSARLVRVAD